MYTKLNIYLTIFLTFIPVLMPEASEPKRFKNAWEVGFTFGEIPFLSGSFKPGLTIGYHFDEHISLSTTYQFKDYLQRDDESFNARNIGFNGLTSSKETTGERFLFALQFRPVTWSPYIVAGFVYNNEDIETMQFDRQKRAIGNSEYDSEITVIQKRESGFVPALGFGYRYDFDNGISLNTNIAAGFFNGISDPVIQINSSQEIMADDKKGLEEEMIHAYKDNFHNHYHIFNLGVSYRFK